MKADLSNIGFNSYIGNFIYNLYPMFSLRCDIDNVIQVVLVNKLLNVKVLS